ncbi:MAG: enoyl-CoA hydratase/isomerase family protein [Pseudorhodoplanes sp.]|nr:enoyl-CoA hydratase/isomerase family protein [Pseudorhodoplanes sp.]
MTDRILTRREGHVAQVVFNNPERHNAMSFDMWEATAAALESFAKDDNVRVVVLSGAGGKAFVSGADISKFGAERASEDAVRTYNAMTERAYDAIYSFPKPTIAMIQGYCIGGGMALAICCDLRIATPGSRFGVPAAKLGLGYEYRGVKRLVDVVGPSFAKEIFYTARQFDAEEARMMGLVNRIVPDAELETYVSNYADTIGGNAPLTIGAIKLTVGEALKDAAERDLRRVEEAVQTCFRSKDYTEGRTAFMEKRKPVFTGR